MGVMKRLATARMFGPLEVKRTIYGDKKPTPAQMKAVRAWKKENGINGTHNQGKDLQ